MRMTVRRGALETEAGGPLLDDGRLTTDDGPAYKKRLRSPGGMLEMTCDGLKQIVSSPICAVTVSILRCPMSEDGGQRTEEETPPSVVSLPSSACHEISVTCAL